MRRDWWLVPPCVIVLLITACGPPLSSASPATEVPRVQSGAPQPDHAGCSPAPHEPMNRVSAH